MSRRKEWLQNNRLLQPRAIREFTDRIPLRKAYHEMVQRCREEDGDLFVMNYYGTGGIGKTSLLRQLMKEVTEREQQQGNVTPAVVMLDFEKVVPDVVHATMAFRNALSRIYPNMTFANYDYAMETLADLSGTDPGAWKEEGSRDGAKGELFSAAEEIVEDVIPYYGTLRKVTGFFGKLVKGVRKKKYLNKDLVDRITQARAEDIQLRLPTYLAMDINQQLEGVLYVFIDTYEKMVAHSEGITSRSVESGADAWICGPHGLIRNLPGTVFCIAGREKLHWEQNDAFWSGRIESHLTEFLAEEDSVNFLLKCGLPEDLSHSIHQLTGGEPVYLDLCVDQYENLLDSGLLREKITIDEFGKNTGALVERHTRYVAEDMQDALYLAAVMGCWNKKAFCCAAEKLRITVQPIQYARLNSLSYVQTDEKGISRMHSVIAAVLSKKMSQKERVCAAEAIIMLAAADMDEWLLEVALGMLGKAEYTEVFCNALKIFANHAGEIWQKEKTAAWYTMAWEIEARLHGIDCKQADETLERLEGVVFFGANNEGLLMIRQARYEDAKERFGEKTPETLLRRCELQWTQDMGNQLKNMDTEVYEECIREMDKLPNTKNPAIQELYFVCCKAIAENALRSADSEKMCAAIEQLQKFWNMGKLKEKTYDILRLRGDLNLLLEKNVFAGQLLLMYIQRIAGREDEGKLMHELQRALLPKTGLIPIEVMDYVNSYCEANEGQPEAENENLSAETEEIVTCLVALFGFGMGGPARLKKMCEEGRVHLPDELMDMLENFGSTAHEDFDMLKWAAPLKSEVMDYFQAAAEVIDILYYTSEADVEKIPFELREFLREIADREHYAGIDPTRSLQLQPILPKTKDILAMIYCYFWATEEEMDELQEEIKQENSQEECSEENRCH